MGGLHFSKDSFDCVATGAKSADAQAAAAHPAFPTIMLDKYKDSGRPAQDHTQRPHPQADVARGSPS